MEHNIAMTAKSHFETTFMALASDGQVRTTAMIRKQLNLPNTINVGTNLANLQMRLAGIVGGPRLRQTTVKGKSHRREWRLEVRN